MSVLFPRLYYKVVTYLCFTLVPGMLKVNEYDHEMLQSHTADHLMAL